MDLGPARQRGVLAALLVEPERPISIQSLVDRVWDGEPPKQVRNVVYTYIARIRRTLSEASQESGAPISVHKEATGYILGVSPDRVDLSNFRHLLADSRSAAVDDPQRRHVLSRALRLWRGQALDGLSSEWAGQLRDSLQQLKFEALAEWADAEIHANCAGTVIDPLRQALIEDPLAEQLHERLVRALHLNGQNNEALRQFERARTIIADELGTDPSHGLQELHQQLLHNSPPAAIGRAAVPVAAAPGTPPQQLPTVPSPARPTGPEGAGPDLLPMGLDDFSGRHKELDRLREMLTSSDGRYHRTVVITGAGGVGKTSLAVRAAHALGAEFPDGRLYVDLHGKCDHPVDSRAVLGRLLRALGMESSGIPAGLDARAELYRNWLSGRRIIVVLDDAADDDQIRALLPGSGSCAVLITSRAQIGGAAGLPLLPLRELPFPEAAQMLAKVSGRKLVEADEQAAREIVHYCSGLPLAIRAVATRLARRPHATLDEVAAHLADEEHRLDALTYAACDIRASLDLSYHRLAPVTSRLFRFLGATLEPDAELAVTPALMLQPGELEEVFEQLTEAHLLHVIGRDTTGRIRYRMPELYRIYARWQAAATRSTSLSFK